MGSVNKPSTKFHEPVMVEEVLEGFGLVKHFNKTRLLGSDKKYIDATLGTGGHTLEILKTGASVLGIEADPSMLKIAQKRIEEEMPGNDKCNLVLGNFLNIDAIAKENEFLDVSGILFDLGISNIHFGDTHRGFSFENPEGELDMRLDPESAAVKASDLLNLLREDQLKDLFMTTMDPGSAKWITKRVLELRSIHPFSKVQDLLNVSKGLRTGNKGINEATLPFLALRIAVNSEYENLESALPKALNIIKKSGRLIVISFHSGEDKIVKGFFKKSASEGLIREVTYKPIVANEHEILRNRRARSAKMRIVEKI